MEIFATLSVLGQYQNPRDGKLRLSDIKAMFRQMREKRYGASLRRLTT